MVGLTVDHTRAIRLLSELVFVFICDRVRPANRGRSVNNQLPSAVQLDISWTWNSFGFRAVTNAIQLD